MSGPLFAIIAAALFGLSSPIAKALLVTMDPWLLAGLLYLGSGVGMAGVYFIRGALPGHRHLQKIVRGEFPWLVGVTLFGGILGPIFLMYGLSSTPASTASLLLNIEGVSTAVIAWMVFKEHYDKRIILGMVAVIFGGAILSWSGGLTWARIWGPLFVLLACLSWGIDNNLTRKISLNDPVLLTMIKSLLAGSTNLALGLSFGAKLPDLQYIAIAGVVGFLCYGLSIVCFILALRKLGASRTGAYFSSAPFVGAAVAIGFWHEPLTARLVIAASFMAFGIYLHLSEAHEHEHTHEELDHEHTHSHDEHHQHEHGINDPHGEPHTHRHRHEKLTHGHHHFPDMHHRHSHS